ncbi:MAG: DUF1611 domain-containing protein, partial [Chlorobi bacterium]|nr:DUF1611 domain-containing protein [Chlorobiota bacterium]
MPGVRKDQEKRRIIILADGHFNSLGSTMANAALLYIPEQVVGVIDSKSAGQSTQAVIGIGGTIPIFRSVEDCLHLSPTYMLIGITPAGGEIPPEWRSVILSAIKHRIEIISGLETPLADDPKIRSMALKHKVPLTELREVPKSHRIIAQGSWRRREAKVILTVGTETSTGKLDTAFHVYQALQRQGLAAAFIGTGQTGILIGGRGIAVDAVPGDFLAGAVELEIDKAANEGYEYIVVEGQGALTHCGVSGVTLGLMHGSMPDALILCHQPTRKVDSYGMRIRPLPEIIDLHERLMSIFKPARVVGISIVSMGLSRDEVRMIQEQIAAETEKPVADVIRGEEDILLDALAEFFSTYSYSPSSIPADI